MSEGTSSPWSAIRHTFLHEGDWAVGQGIEAPDRRALRAVLRALLAEHSQVSLLEVGTGAGIEAEGLRAHGLLDLIDYVGYDLTPEFVEHCREAFPEARFEIVDAGELDQEGAAELVWARHLVEHVEDPLSVIERLWLASRDTTLISWFIRPTFRPDEMGCGIADGFRHWHLDAREVIGFVTDLGAHLFRYDFDHHGTLASVWALRRSPTSLPVLDHFFASAEFLDALLPATVPSREQELMNSEQALLGIVREVEATLDFVAPTLNHGTEVAAAVRHAQKRCKEALGDESDD